MKKIINKITVILFASYALGFSLTADAQSPDYFMPQFLQCDLNSYHRLECKLPAELVPYLQFYWGGGHPGTFTFIKAHMPYKNGYVLYDYQSPDKGHTTYEFQTTYTGITADITYHTWIVHADGSADCTVPDGNCPFTNVPYIKK